WMRHGFCLCTALVLATVCLNVGGQQPDSDRGNVSQPSTRQSPSDRQASSAGAVEGVASVPSAESAELSGTVTDVAGDLIPRASITLESSDASSHETQVANDSAFFQFQGLKPGVTYRVTVSAKGFQNWVSSPVILAAGQFFDVPGIKLKLEDTVSSVTVYSSTEQIATQQVEIAEQQRIMGFIPN